jgi:hypothetical protein
MRVPALVLLLAFSGFLCPGCRKPSAAAVQPAEELRAGTYNLLGGTRDFPKTAAVIRELHADVVALQEVAPDCIPLM